MNLKSCDKCAVVLDVDNINFPETSDDSGEVILENCEWLGNWQGYVAFVRCPVCDNKIFEGD